MRCAPFALLALAAAAGGFAGGLAAANPAGFPTLPAHFVFGDAASPGATVVPLTRFYSAAGGYGFEPGTALVAAHPAGVSLFGAVVAGAPFAFSVRVPQGNYRVAVTLGDPRARSLVTVKAETRRLYVEHVTVEPGRTLRRTFTVNVRGPQLAGGGRVDLDSRELNLATGQPLVPHWDDKLTLTFGDAHPARVAVEIEPAPGAVTLFLAGDSTVTDQPHGPGSSWGQMVPRWFGPEVAVANHAESGETLKGFLKERRWDKVLESLRPGDTVLIEFGTNDSKSSGPQNIYPNQDFSETYAPAGTTYRELLRRFVGDVRRKGGVPVAATPSARRGEVAGPTSLAPWVEAALAVAAELHVPAIDLNGMGVEINAALGPDADRQFGDRTHHVEYGSYLQAKAIVLGLQRAGVPVARYIVPDFSFDPRHPTPRPADFLVPPDAPPSLAPALPVDRPSVRN